MLKRIFTRENGLALLLCLTMILLMILLTDRTPSFIYQGF